MRNVPTGPTFPPSAVSNPGLISSGASPRLAPNPNGSSPGAARDDVDESFASSSASSVDRARGARARADRRVVGRRRAAPATDVEHVARAVRVVVVVARIVAVCGARAAIDRRVAVDRRREVGRRTAIDSRAIETRATRSIEKPSRVLTS